MESNFIKFIKEVLPQYPIYAFVIPQDAPDTALCFENAGHGVSTNRYGEDIVNRTIKLTLSTKDVSLIFNDQALRSHIKHAHQMGDLPLISARLLNFSDNFSKEQKLYERTYSIQLKYKDI